MKGGEKKKKSMGLGGGGGGTDKKCILHPRGSGGGLHLRGGRVKDVEKVFYNCGRERSIKEKNQNPAGGGREKPKKGENELWGPPLQNLNTGEPQKKKKREKG